MLIGLEWTTTHTHTHKHSYIPPPHVQHSPRHSYTCIIQHYIKHLPAEAIILTSQLILQRFKCRCRCTSRQYFLTTCCCGVGDTHHPFEAELHDSHSSWWRYHRGDKMTTAQILWVNECFSLRSLIPHLSNVGFASFAISSCLG